MNILQKILELFFPKSSEKTQKKSYDPKNEAEMCKLATAKLNQVRDCNNTLMQKILNKYKSIDDVKKTRQSLLETIVAYKNAGDMDRARLYASQHKELGAKLLKDAQMAKLFIAIRRIVTRFLLELEDCVEDFCWYEYVIDEIDTENLTRKLLSDKAGDTIGVTKEVEWLVNKMEKKMEETFTATGIFENVMAGIEQRARFMNDNDNLDEMDDYINSILDEDIPDAAPADRKQDTSKSAAKKA